MAHYVTDDATILQMADGLRGAFDDDKAILEAIEVNGQVERDWPRVTLAIDASPRQMRRMVDRRIAEESRA